MVLALPPRASSFLQFHHLPRQRIVVLPDVDWPRGCDWAAPLGIPRYIDSIVAIADLEPRLSGRVDRIRRRVLWAVVLSTGRLGRTRRHRVPIDV